MCSALSAMNCDIITGGGPGLMQAANEGARTAEESQGARSNRNPGSLAVRAARESVRGFELAGPQDMEMPRCVDTGAEAVAVIREFFINSFRVRQIDISQQLAYKSRERPLAPAVSSQSLLAVTALTTPYAPVSAIADIAA
jgi:hypothetical protein